MTVLNYDRRAAETTVIEMDYAKRLRPASKRRYRPTTTQTDEHSTGVSTEASTVSTHACSRAHARVRVISFSSSVYLPPCMSSHICLIPRAKPRQLIYQNDRNRHRAHRVLHNSAMFSLGPVIIQVLNLRLPLFVSGLTVCGDALPCGYLRASECDPHCSSVFPP